MMEAIALCEEIAGKELGWTYSETNRIGDHIWYISDTRKFKSHYPEWRQEYDLRRLLVDIYEKNVDRWMRQKPDVVRASGREEGRRS
jgi:CDP-paratose 2-epimerase